MSDQATASSTVDDLGSLKDNLNSSLASIEEDSKELIDEYRESLETHFRAPSVERAVGYHLPDRKIEQMSSSEEDSHHYEDEDDEGGFTQAQLEALEIDKQVETIDARRPSRPETGTVDKLLSAFETQHPHLYAAALKAKSAAPFTAAPAATRTQGLPVAGISDQNI